MKAMLSDGGANQTPSYLPWHWAAFVVFGSDREVAAPEGQGASEALGGASAGISTESDAALDEDAELAAAIALSLQTP